MDNLSINTTKQIVPTPVTYTAQTEMNPAPVARMDTNKTDATVKPETENVDMEKLSKMLNKTAEKENLDVSFGYNEKIDRVYINIVDKNSGDVIRKLPSEEAMKFAEGMQDVIGKLFDKKG